MQRTYDAAASAQRNWACRARDLLFEPRKHSHKPDAQAGKYGVFRFSHFVHAMWS